MIIGFGALGIQPEKPLGKTLVLLELVVGVNRQRNDFEEQ